jgi:hypothetical protein
MTSTTRDWRTYPRTGARTSERFARHRAAKFGYRLHRTRHRKGPDNAGEYLLIHKASSTVLLGAGFTATHARQLGCRLRCSRRRGDGKKFMLTKHDVVLLGAGYTATVEDVSARAITAAGNWEYLASTRNNDP